MLAQPMPRLSLVDIHRLREEQECGAKHGMNEVVSCKDARGIGGICIYKVVQDCFVDLYKQRKSY
jgi:hypothetical protein